ncbi:MAG: DUF2721 domain-containing protein [Pseudobacteriovorax sp.]|nr:DUF2721 domain-containing protein [Pseudobacteriovorax sp.]
MPEFYAHTNELVKILSASVAPVFLITGIAAIISSMSFRYGRVIDRTRTILRDGPKLYGMALGADHMDQEIKTLHRRARMLRLMIILEIFAATFVVMTIISVFLSLAFQIEVGDSPIIFFVMSLVCLIGGLIYFIGEFFLSLKVLEHDIRVRANIDVES